MFCGRALLLVTVLWPLVALGNPGLDFINRARTENGLRPFTLQEQLNRAAEGHARYMAAHGDGGHLQTPGLEHFTGATWSDRAAAAGYSSRMVAENVSYGQNSWLQSAEGLMGAIYHRLNFLRFDVDELGMAMAVGVARDDARKSAHYFGFLMGNSLMRELCQGSGSQWGVSGMCVDTSFRTSRSGYDHARSELSRQGPALVTYPWSGQHDVFPAYLGDESPDPWPGLGLTGQPVSIHFNPLQYQGKDISIRHFQLLDADQQKVELLPRLDKSSDHRNQLFDEYSFAWFPRQALEWDSKYQVELEYQIGQELHSYQWYFYTAPVADEGRRIVIRKAVSHLHLSAGTEYLLLLSNELSKSKIQHISMDYYGGHSELKIRAFNALRLQSRGPGVLKITLHSGQIYTVHIHIQP